MATTDIHVHSDVHHHDDHEHEHHEGNFWTNYIFSEDHKVIGKQFLITGIFWALMGGTFSILFRLQLGFLRRALSLPDTTEKIAWSMPTFRVAGKMFATLPEDAAEFGAVREVDGAPPVGLALVGLWAVGLFASWIVANALLSATPRR